MASRRDVNPSRYLRDGLKQAAHIFKTSMEVETGGLLRLTDTYLPLAIGYAHFRCHVHAP